MLLVMSIGGYILRQEPSTAYWVLSFVPSSDTPSLQIISPSGEVRNKVIQAAPINDINFICWLPDGESFLYEWHTEDRLSQIRVLRLDDVNNPQILTNHRLASETAYFQNNCWFIEDYHYLALRNSASHCGHLAHCRQHHLLPFAWPLRESWHWDLSPRYSA